MQRLNLFAVVLVLAPQSISAFGADAPARDALQLADEGKISIEAVAAGAYKMHVRLKNNTADDLNVEFPPGLIADTYARFALFQVGGGGGMQTGGGGQSTGLLRAEAIPLAGNANAIFDMQTACLNLGAPEPTPKTVLMLKRVEDFTSDAVFQYLLKDLAGHPPEQAAVSQAALWHVVDKVDWPKIARIHSRHGRFSDEEIEEAKSRVGAAVAAASSAGRNSQKKATAVHLPALSVLIHPDPRGRHQDAGLARDAARNLRERWPGVDVAHRDFTPDPKDENADAVAWCFLVRSVGSAKAPDLQLTPQRNVWSPAKKQWKHEPVGQPIAKTPPSSDVGAWLAEAVVQYIAAKSLVVEKASEDRLIFRNAAPVALAEIFVTTGAAREPALKLPGLSLGPGEEKEVALPAEHLPRLASAKKITAAGFTPTSAKAPGG